VGIPSINKLKPAFGRAVALAALVIVALTSHGLAVEPIDDGVAEQSNVCEIHHFRMRLQLVPILYGLPTQDSVYLRELTVRAQQFPHRSGPVLGGCVVSSESPRQAKVWVCEKCDAAWKQWLATQQKR
jgi:hypothetical protein